MYINTLKICSSNYFLNFLSKLKKDFYTDFDNWQNVNVESYLEAIIAWLQVCERLNANDQKYIFSNMLLVDWNMALNIMLQAVEMLNDSLTFSLKPCIDDANPKAFSNALQIKLDQCYKMNITLTQKIDVLIDNFIALLRNSEKVNLHEVNPCVWMFLALILEVGKIYE